MTKMNQEVQAVFDAAPLHARETMLRLRALIFEVAANLPEIGRIHETLRWGQPAYVTSKRAGASLRIAVPKTGGVELYTHCQTSLIADFTATFPGMDQDLSQSFRLTEERPSLDTIMLRGPRTA